MLVLTVALGVRLVNVAEMSRLPMAEYQFRATEADMYFAYEWSGRILRGDLLGREPVHQYTMWMRELAPLETWERWWGGANMFDQAPLYAYTLAAFRFLAGDHFWPIALCQAALGVANVALVYLLAARLFGGAVPVVAGLGAALYGPFLLHETLLLRDTLGTTVSLLLLWWLAGCRDSSALPWLVAGWLFAVALLAREVTLVFAPFVALWIMGRFRRDARALATVVLSFVAGLALGLAPLVGRNVAVGAPPLSLSTSGIVTFVNGNAVDSAGFGWKLSAATRSILEQANGHLGTAMRLTLATYHGDWRQFLALQILKLRAIFASYEATDNINWYYFADHLPFLRFSLHFEHVLALAVIGLWLDRRNATRHQILWLFLVAALCSLMYSTVVGRYRLPGTAVLLIYAAVAVDWAGRRIAEREWRALALAGVAGAGIMLASASLLRSTELRTRYPPSEYSANARLYYERGQIDEACGELRRGLEKAYAWPDHTALPPQYLAMLARPYVSLAHTLRRDGEAVAVLEHLASSFPADGALQELIGVVYRDGMNRPDEAARHLERARELGTR
jgi:4-amino-4-deoxy-L-arabinose transferase-like glycosyltransferase